MNDDKNIRSDAKLKGLPDADLEFLWSLRNPEDAETKRLSLEECGVEILSRYNIAVAISTVSDFYRWLKLKRRMDTARATAEQITRDIIKDDPSISQDEIAATGQKIFMAEAIHSGDSNAYVAVRRLMLEEKRLRSEEEKNRLRSVEKIEAGLDELFKEIEGNAKAEAIFKKLREVLAK